MRKALIAIVAVVVLGAAALWLLGEPQGRRVATVAVEQGPVSSNITVTGKVSGERLVEIAAQQAGKVTEVNVAIGERVSRGDVLARLDDALASANLAKARATVEAAAADVGEAERRLVRARLVGSAESEQAVEALQAEVARAEARLQQARADVDLARIQLEQHTLVAPFDGVVIERDAEVGKVVAPGWTGAQRAKHLFTLLDDRQRLIEANVDAGDSATIAVGDLVIVSSEAYPDFEWEEQVVYVSPVVERRLEEETANTFRVDIGLGENAPPLLFGQQVDLTIRAGHVESALKLPYQAIAMREGRPYVARAVDGRVRYQPIETGIESLTHVEVVSGLGEGDEVILLEGQLLREGELLAPPPHPGGPLGARREQIARALDTLLGSLGLSAALSRWGLDTPLERSVPVVALASFVGLGIMWRRRVNGAEAKSPGRVGRELERRARNS
ncbi:MAG: efflux RND transporter periplasmic adaptor subunit [Gammaproteobacteria bacterium]|nr:efflux RND transporter periplasmic adaptor subunit [Gammaproteobacteria bacterium]